MTNKAYVYSNLWPFPHHLPILYFFSYAGEKERLKEKNCRWWCTCPSAFPPHHLQGGKKGSRLGTCRNNWPALYPNKWHRDHGWSTLYPLGQWSPTLGLQMFLDYNSQKPTPPPLLARISGNWSPRTSGGPRLRTTALGDIKMPGYQLNQLTNSSKWRECKQLWCGGDSTAPWLCDLSTQSPYNDNWSSFCHHMYKI